jgi:hypothetical protein
VGAVLTHRPSPSDRLAPPSLALVLCTVFLAACGGGEGQGTAPVTPAAATVPGTISQLAATIAPEIGGRTVVDLTWSGGAGAQSFLVEVGSKSGATDVARMETSTSPFRWTSVPVGTFYVRVRGRNGVGEGPASADVLVGSVDPRDVIDALFLGQGQLAVSINQGCPAGGNRMAGWPSGSRIRLVVAQAVPAGKFNAAVATGEQFTGATLGAVAVADVSRTDDPDPIPRDDEITIAEKSAEETQTLCRTATPVGGCASSIRDGLGRTRRVRIVMSRTGSGDSGVAHELGHALGLCHIIAAAGFTPTPTMGINPDGTFTSVPGRLARFDPASLKATETVWGAGLRPGTFRAAFVSAGLIPSEPSGFAGELAAEAEPGEVIGLEDGRVMVIRPFCWRE